jgi:hypothetical protein
VTLPVGGNFYVLIPIKHEKATLYAALLSRGEIVKAASARVGQTFFLLAVAFCRPFHHRRVFCHSTLGFQTTAKPWRARRRRGAR